MCFSESVSFVSGAILIAGGVLASMKAFKINKRYLAIAIMPIMAGIQQIFEGHVWMGMNNANDFMVWWGAMGFIFFSWFMWPVWIPFSIYMLEPVKSRRKKPLLCFALAGLIFGLVLYIPHIINPQWIDVVIKNNSLAYEGTMFLDYIMPRPFTYLIYLFLIITPPFLSTYLHIRFFGMTLLAIVTVVYMFLTYAYISFFCLMAGVGTIHLIYIILRNKCCRECPDIFK